MLLEAEQRFFLFQEQGGECSSRDGVVEAISVSSEASKALNPDFSRLLASS